MKIKDINTNKAFGTISMYNQHNVAAILFVFVIIIIIITCQAQRKKRITIPV